VRAAVLLNRIKKHVPRPVGGGRRRLRLPGEGHRHRLARVGLAPDFVPDALLQDHVVAEHVVERHVTPGGGGGGDGEQESDEREADAGHGRVSLE